MDSKDLLLVRLLLGLSREAFAYLLGCSNVQIYAQERLARLHDLQEELENEQKRGDDND